MPFELPKSIAATGIVVIGIVGVYFITRAYNWIPTSTKKRGRMGVSHRVLQWSVLSAAAPIAYLCVSFEFFNLASQRVLLHIIFGALTILIFPVKILIVEFLGRAEKYLPVFGGILIVSLIIAWATSGYWFLNLLVR